MVGIYKKYSLKMKIYLYRRLEANIGRNVRLYGKIDGMNPHPSILEAGSVVTEEMEMVKKRLRSLGYLD